MSLNIQIAKKPGNKQHFSGVIGSSIALSLAHVSLQYKKQHLIITDNAKTALKLSHELKFCLLNSELNIYMFPDLETLPYDNFSASEDIISERLRTLNNIQIDNKAIVIVSIATMLKYLPPESFLASQTFVVKKGQTLNLSNERTRLEKTGYQCVNQVIQRGEFSIRGSILDIYPMGANNPSRIDLFDDEVDSIRSFDIDTQRSDKPIDKIEILPTHEFILDNNTINHFASSWQNSFSEKGIKCPLYSTTLNGKYAGGIEYYLPLFFPALTTLLDYLDKDTLISHIYHTTKSVQSFWQEIKTRYEQLAYDIEKPILAPEKIYIEPNELFSQLKNYRQFYWHQENKAKSEQLPFQPLPDVHVHYQYKQPFKLLLEHISKSNQKVIFTADSLGRKEVLSEHLHKLAIKIKSCSSLAEAQKSKNQYILLVSPLSKGFIWENKFSFITESDLFKNHIPNYTSKKSKQPKYPSTELMDMSDLKPGAAVVHIDHGVGRYQGLTSLDMSGQETEYLTITYSNEEKLYVPIHSLHLVSRYSGTDIDRAPLNKLGTDKWQKTKERATKKIRDVAAELLEIYAKRALKTGFSNALDKQEYLAFSDGFPFEETNDQQLAIQDVLNDMMTNKPMDRLICGDVGFGKTEVAMRATFLAVHNNKQIAILVPTTLLAQQHYENFQDRFAEMGVNVDVLSRFKTAKQQKEIMEKLAKGKVDIIIGTHKLLAKNIQFSNLGLLIIDEEHRFGVSHKEKIKGMRADIDILTMTATPIPRTLNMALASVRDLSIITTPPLKRLAVKTFVRQYNPDTVKEAILRETLRGGQVFFLHNKVETIFAIKEKLQKLFPDLKIAVAHGQMRERELEHIMHRFQQNHYQVLVCTTIIETGIDIPNANTIIIDRADNFGLAQLHQLRGRVGRSFHQAYAYLITPPAESLSKDANKRLEAIKESDSLGAGFILANHDLEIRGAGELLGKEQSGNIEGIGFSLYMDLLNKTVLALQKGESINKIDFDKTLNNTSEIELRIPALIPDDYLMDTHLRLILYKRIANSDNHQQLDDIKIEMIDRFGKLPLATKNLFETAHLRIDAWKLGVKKIEMHSGGGSVQFVEKLKIDPINIIKMAQKNPDYFRLTKTDKLVIKRALTNTEERIKFANEILKKLAA